jgi:dynein heavy chain
MVINFTVTQEGLFEKLLGDILALELPDDDKIRRELILSIAEDRLLLKKGEDRILDLLTNSRGMILDDIELIESLKISKEIAKAVSDKIQVSEVKQEELNKGMRLYTSVAKRGVVLYFVITELSLIDPMY